MKVKHWNILGAVLVMLLASGCCGSSDDSSDNPPQVNMPSTPATPTPATPTPATPTPTPVPTPTKGMPSPGGNVLAVGAPTGGMFTTSLPTTPDGKPYIDYTLNIAAPGNYTINLISGNTTAYDPYLVLLQNNNQLATDDDGGGYPNARITRMLTPGAYVVRVTRFGSGQVSAMSPFTLTVTQ